MSLRYSAEVFPEKSGDFKDTGPRNSGEWLGEMRKTDRDLDMVLFVGEQTRKEQTRLTVPNRIRTAGDLENLALSARGWVWGNSVPTVGVSNWEDQKNPFGVALAQPKLSFEGARRGQVTPETVEAMQGLLGLETRIRHLYQLKGSLEVKGHSEVYDILSGRELNHSQVEAEIEDLLVRVWPIRLVNAAKAINGMETRQVDRAVTQRRNKDVIPFFQPSAAVVQEASSAQPRSFRPGKGFMYLGGAAALGVILSACGSSPTTAPTVEVSPTMLSQATETSTALPPTATQKPTEVPPTKTPSATPTELPTKTPEPTSTPITAESIARSHNFFIEGRTYSQIDGYLVDDYNKAKMLKLEGGKWVDTTLEEKFGHLAPKDGYYGVTSIVGHAGGETLNSTGLEMIWTGSYTTETVLVSGIDKETTVTWLNFVTRNSKGELILVKSFNGGFTNTGSGITLVPTNKTKGKTSDLNGHVFNYIDDGIPYSLAADLKDVTKFLDSKKITLVGSRVNVNVQDLTPKLRKFFQGWFGITCAEGMPLYDCDAAVYGQLSRTGVVPEMATDGLIIKDAMKHGGLSEFVLFRDNLEIYFPDDDLKLTAKELARMLVEKDLIIDRWK